MPSTPHKVDKEKIAVRSVSFPGTRKLADTQKAPETVMLRSKSKESELANMIEFLCLPTCLRNTY